MLHLESTSFRGLTCLALAGALLAACGDDGPADTGNGGRGGSSGAAGASGASGSSGASGASGAAGSAGNGGSAGTPDGGAEPPPCRDCVELRVPVDDSDQTALFRFEAGPFDMSQASILFRMRPLTRGEQLLASPFAQDSDLQGFVDWETRLREETFPKETWVTIDFPVAAFPPPDLILPPDAGPNDGDAGIDASALVPDPTDFDSSRVTRFGLRVGTSPNYAGPAATLVVLVDTVSFQRVAGDPLAEKTFDENAEGLTLDLEASTPGAEIIHHPAD